MAKIFLICEGSYPYIVGGVSSWVQDLVSTNSDHEFIIMCIIPNEDFIKVKYEIPKNVIQIVNIILNIEYNPSELKILRNNSKITKEIQDKIFKLLDYKNIASKDMFEILDSINEISVGNPLEFFNTEKVWEILESYYKEKYPTVSMKTFYWTYRNIILNILALSRIEIPKADIYHPVATGYSGFIAAFAKHKNNSKVLLTEHGIYPREREEEVLSSTWIEKDFKGIWVDYFYFLSRVAYDYSDIIISLFEYNKELQIEGLAKREKCIVIPNGVNAEMYSAIKREKKDKFIVGSILRVVPIKDVKMMLKAFKVVIEKIQNIQFYLVGSTDEDESYYFECVELVKQLELEDYVVFTGRRDVKDYYKFIDILLLTSLSEGQPLSILEGLAAGIPFIATDVGNCREVLIGKRDIGESGVIVPPTDYTQLGEEIIKLYHNEERRKIMGINGKKIVNRYYTKEYYIGEYRKIYESLS